MHRGMLCKRYAMGTLPRVIAMGGKAKTANYNRMRVAPMHRNEAAEAAAWAVMVRTRAVTDEAVTDEAVTVVTDEAVTGVTIVTDVTAQGAPTAQSRA